MTRIMKRIYNILIATAALFAFAPIAGAQTDWSINGQIQDAGNNNAAPVYPKETNIPVQIDKEKAVAYSKNISKPFSDGTYWIKLETFATGSASYTVSNEPADIVLVLDFSSSMNTNYATSETYTYVPRVSNRKANYNNTGNPAGSWDYNNIATNYILFEGDYHQVSGGRSGNYYYLSFTANGKTYYLDQDTITDVMPTNATSQYHACWTSALYERRTSVTRLQALKAAVADFVDVIYHNDNYEGDGYDKPRTTKLGNRISVVVFSTYETSSITRVLVDWTDVTTSSGARDETIIKAITNEGYNTGTATEEGISLAHDQLGKISSERLLEASQTVVMFSDGAPHAQYWSDANSGPYANQAIKTAKNIEQDFDATVFSVLLTSDTSANLRNFMQGLSSNYPQATAYDNLGARCDDTETYGENAKEAVYYHLVGEDLSAVFQAIAKQSGGSSNTSLSAATSTVDVVSSSFMLPEGADASSIKVFTAKCTYADPDNGTYTFNTETLVDHSNDTYNTYDSNGNVTGTYDVDAQISVDLGTDADGNPKIEVVGFDYSNNWCGPVTDEDGNVTYQGHKVIIMIPIQMNPDAVGGPNVGTNTEGSGIFVNGTDDDPLIPFISPHVSLPVNIYIKKSGLRHGESAKFKIERAQIPIPMPDNLDPESLTYSYVSTIFVTQPDTATDGADVTVKVKGLPANISTTVGYIYRITEEEWAWSYLRDTEPQYTVTSKVDNPFEFSNTKKDQIDIKVRHAESKANNVFKATGASTEYDDSKQNDRTTTTPTTED